MYSSLMDLSSFVTNAPLLILKWFEGDDSWINFRGRWGNTQKLVNLSLFFIIHSLSPSLYIFSFSLCICLSVLVPFISLYIYIYILFISLCLCISITLPSPLYSLSLSVSLCISLYLSVCLSVLVLDHFFLLSPSLSPSLYSLLRGCRIESL